MSLSGNTCRTKQMVLSESGNKDALGHHYYEQNCITLISISLEIIPSEYGSRLIIRSSFHLYKYSIFKISQNKYILGFPSLSLALIQLRLSSARIA